MDHDNSAYEQLYPCPDPCAWRRRLEQLRRDVREALAEFAAWPLMREELVNNLLSLFHRALAAEILGRRDALDPPTTNDERVAEAAAREVAAGPNGTAEPVGAEAASSTEASNGELPFREEDW